jgi:hypothetical protein
MSVIEKYIQGIEALITRYYFIEQEWELKGSIVLYMKKGTLNALWDSNLSFLSLSGGSR